MAQVRDYNKLAHDIIREVGGAQNIVNATRCATRCGGSRDSALR